MCLKLCHFSTKFRFPRAFAKQTNQGFMQCTSFSPMNDICCLHQIPTRMTVRISVFTITYGRLVGLIYVIPGSCTLYWTSETVIDTHIRWPHSCCSHLAPTNENGQRQSYEDRIGMQTPKFLQGFGMQGSGSSNRNKGREIICSELNVVLIWRHWQRSFKSNFECYFLLLINKNEWVCWCFNKGAFTSQHS